MIERVERVAPAGAIVLDPPLEDPDCAWCGDRLDEKGDCARHCEASRHARMDASKGSR